MRKAASLLTMLMLFCVLAFAQTRTISGTVRDAQGNPVPFATISEAGTKNAVQADANGNYAIKVGANSKLNITATNYTAINGSAGGNIVLSRNAEKEQLQEVVVTALGQVRQAKELGYSTAKVRSTELTQAAPVNLQNGLTGKVSGLNINTTNNGVFANTRITLRGIRSLTGNNQPMLILDGVPLSLGYISSINPNDIADVTILKSSSSTAVYGPDGVNGAIVITTKRGTKGKPTITLSHTVQLESISYMPKFQEEFGSGYTPDAFGNGTFEPIEQQSWGDRFDGSIRQFGQTGPNGEKLMLPYSYVKNGRKNFFNTGVTNQTDVSFSTGDFYVSAQNVAIQGVLPGDENNRRAFTFKAEKEYNKFKAGFNLRYTQSKYDVTNNNTLVYYDVTGAPGQYDLSMFKDWRNDYFSSPNGYYTPYLDNNGKTPYFAKDNYRETGRSDDLFGNAEFNYKFAPWLSLTYRIGTTVTNGDSRSTRGAFTYSAFQNTLRDHATTSVSAAVTDASSFSTRLTSEVFANFNKRFSVFGVNALIGQQYRESSSRFLSVGSNNLGQSTLLSVVARKGEPTVGSTNSKTRLERYFGKLAFDYNNWAFIEATGSYDIDSRLAHPGSLEKKSDIAFFYPGVNASLVLHQVIPALKESNIISFAKVRGAISKTGNVNLPAYSFENSFTTGLFFPYGDILGYQATASTVASEYSPEFVKNKEVGLELGFLKNRINFEATYYNQDNTDQVIDVQQSNTTGYTTAKQNAASFVNKGLELDLRLTPLVKLGDVNIDFKVNYSHMTNKIYSLVDGVNELGIGNFNYAIVGMPAYVFKLQDYDRDAEGHVIVGADGMPTKKLGLTTFGHTMPEHILGLNLNVSWKGLSFSAVGDYRAGNQIVADQLGGFLDDNGISIRSAQNGRRAFVFPNSVYADPANPGKYITNTDRYTQVYGRPFWNSDLNTGVTSNYLANGAFWKLREVALNYEIPMRIFGSRISSVIKGATIGINGRNLLMFLPKSNQWTDPEFSANGNSAYTGNAVGRSTAYNLPPTRIFGANLSVRF